FSQYTPEIGLYLLDNEGRVLVPASRAAPGGTATRVDIGPVARSLAQHARAPIKGEDPEAPGTTRLVAAMPVLDEGTQQGWLYVVPRKRLAEPAGETYRDYALRTAGRVGLLTLAIGA